MSASVAASIAASIAASARDVARAVVVNAAAFAVFIAPGPWAGPARAQTAALSPDDAVRLALARSDDVRSALLDAEKVRLDEGAIRWSAPQLQLGHRAVDTLAGTTDPATGVTSSVDPFADSQLGVSWKPPAWHEMGVDQDIGARAADAALRDVQELRADLATEVRTLHARVLSLRAQEALARSRVEMLQRVTTWQQARVDQQAGTSLDASLTTLDALDARGDVSDVQAELARYERRLAFLLGVPLPLSLAPSSAPLCAVPTDDDVALVERARAHSSRLRGLAVREQALAPRRTRAWLGFVPWIDALQVGYLPRDGDGEVRARVDIALPVLHALDPDLQLLDVDERRLDLDRRAALASLEQQVRSARETLERSVELVHSHDDARASIDASERLVDTALRAEVIDVLRVAAVHDRVLRARRQALRAQLACDEAALQLQRVLGLELEATTSAQTSSTTSTSR